MRDLIAAVAVTVCFGTASAAEITRASVLTEMNRQREAAGLSPLAEDPRLVKAAEYRVRDMEELEYWAHKSPDGRSPFEMLRPFGYDYHFAGENLASGFETAEVLVESWMESKGHRDNIISPLYEHCGIAIIEGSTVGRATGRSVVVLFGRPLAPAKTSSAALSAP